jgi:hypothetical protein
MKIQQLELKAWLMCYLAVYCILENFTQDHAHQKGTKYDPVLLQKTGLSIRMIMSWVNLVRLSI